MKILSATFVVSVTDYHKCPPPVLPEYAFIGRSNVGKSSLINMLTGQKKLAKTSNTPGKTQTVNHFLINEQWYLTDLPGYGYARTSKSAREKFGKMITSYLANRKNLLNTFLLIDSRLEPQKIDLEFMEWMADHGLPFSLVFTKADKLGVNRIKENIDAYCKVLLNTWEELPPRFITSSEDQTGKEELLGFIGETNTIFRPEMIR